MTTLIMEMPGDQDWEPEFWDRLGVGPDWDRISQAFKDAGAEVEDDEDVTFECPTQEVEQKVRQIIRDARDGVYGEDVQVYYKAGWVKP